MLNNKNKISHCPDCKYSKEYGYNGCCLECPNYTECNLNDGLCQYINNCYGVDWGKIDAT